MQIFFPHINSPYKRQPEIHFLCLLRPSKFFLNCKRGQKNAEPQFYLNVPALTLRDSHNVKKNQEDKNLNEQKQIYSTYHLFQDF